MLRTASTQGEQLKAYTDPSLPLAPKLVDEVATFLWEALGKGRLASQRLALSRDGGMRCSQPAILNRWET